MKLIIRSFAALAALTLVAAGCGSGSNSASPASANGTSVVRAENNQSLGASVLVNRRGMTLYALSAEKHGRFICTSGDLPGTTTPCVSVWHPLLVSQAHSLGTAVPHLGTVQRPGGSESQVTYNGMPLYTFANDRAPGDVTGNGLKDVGTWRPATVGASAGQGATTGGSMYGGY